MTNSTQRKAFEDQYSKAFPIASKKLGKFEIDQQGEYVDAGVFIGWTMYQASISKSDHAQALSGAVYVCPDRDIECGSRSSSWCAACPKHNLAQPSAQSPGIDAVKVRYKKVIWVEQGKIAEAHHCKCSHVTRCDIYTHPSRKVQDALNTLMDAMAEFDEESGGVSMLSFESKHQSGIFTSLTENDKPIHSPLPSQPEPLGQVLSDDDLCKLAEQHGAGIEWANQPEEFHHIIKMTPPELRALLHKAGASGRDAKDVLHRQSGIAAMNGAPSHCLWKTGCSNSKRCSANGSCVAAAQRADLSQPSDDGRGKP